MEVTKEDMSRETSFVPDDHKSKLLLQRISVSYIFNTT